MKTLFYLPGLGSEDTLQRQRWVINLWNTKNIRAVMFEPNWHGAESIESKIDRLLKLFDECKSDENYLAASSAGATLVTILLNDRGDEIQAAKVACGKFKGIDTVGPDFRAWSPILVRALEKSEEAITRLYEEGDQLSKITSYVPLGDQVVPLEDMKIPEAKTKRIYTQGHVFSIAISLLTVLNPRLAKY